MIFSRSTSCTTPRAGRRPRCWKPEKFMSASISGPMPPKLMEGSWRGFPKRRLLPKQADGGRPLAVGRFKSVRPEKVRRSCQQPITSHGDAGGQSSSPVKSSESIGKSRRFLSRFPIRREGLSHAPLKWTRRRDDLRHRGRLSCWSSREPSGDRPGTAERERQSPTGWGPRERSLGPWRGSSASLGGDELRVVSARLDGSAAVTMAWYRRTPPAERVTGVA